MGKPKGRKADFQKVKLKIGRRLPKGLNITDTSFKSKKIVIREQLLKDASTENASRKRGIKEILARLQHYSPGTRHESLVTLKDLLDSNPNLIQNNIASLIERVCELMVDRDGVVRKMVITVLTEMLKNVSTDLITPFFPIITSYLCCAMSHIQSGIQSDSLKILDLLLDSFPTLTVSSSSQIFKNFLDQISSVKNDSKTRVLLVQPSEKLTSQKWRLEVLGRVQKFLYALLECWDSNHSNEMEDDLVDIHWDGTGKQSVTLYAYGLEPVLANNFRIHQLKEGKSPTKDVQQARSFIFDLLPLLVDTWVEASPERNYIKSGNMLSFNASEILECVLRVIASLLSWIEKLSEENSSTRLKNLTWFHEVFYKNFVTFFLRSFPYSMLETELKHKKGKQKTSVTSQVSLISLNLIICEIFVLLVPVIDDSSLSQYEDIIQFLLKLLSSEKMKGFNNISTSVRIVRHIAKRNVDHAYTLDLLRKLSWLYKHWPSTRTDRLIVENFYMELVSSSTFRELLNSPPLTSWLEQLPSDILKNVENPDRLLELLKKADKISSCRYPAFVQGLLSCGTQIIALLDKLPFEDEELFKAQRYLMNIIYSLPTIGDTAFRQLTEVLRNPIVDIKNVNYMIQNLNYRFQRKEEPGFHPAHYLSLLLCIQFGVSQQEATMIQQKFRASPDCQALQHCMPRVAPVIVVPSDSDVWDRQQSITANISRYIFGFPESIDVQKAVFTYIAQILEIFSYLPAHAVSGIFGLASYYLKESEMDDSSYQESTEQLKFSLFDLVLGTLNASCALSVAMDDSPVDDPRMADFMIDMATDYIETTECIEPICTLLERNVRGLKRVSEAQGECLGLILSKLLKFEEPEGGSLASMAKILQMIQNLTDGHRSRSKWLNALKYEFKMKTQMCREY